MEFVAANWHDILVNLVAGVPFFVLDTIVIALLVPLSLWQFDRLRWRKLRHRFLGDLLADQRTIAEVLEYHLKNAGDDYRRSSITRERMTEIWTEGFRKIDTRFTALDSRIESSMGFYSMMLTPSVASSLILWREALTGFAATIRDLSWTMWQGSPVRIRAGAEEYAAQYEQAVATLNSATLALIKSDDLPDRSRRGSEDQISLLPADHLTPDVFDYWTGAVASAWETIRNTAD
jgi:hypothetical protein